MIISLLVSNFLSSGLSRAEAAVSAESADATAGRVEETRYAPLYGDIKPLRAGDSLYVFTKGRRRFEDNQLIAIQTLQGIVSRTDRPRVWIDNADDTFLNYLAENYGIRFDRKYARDFPALLAELKPCTSGQYMLYDMDDKSSISVAASMAGLLDAVAIDVNLEPSAKASGYSQALDVRGKDCRWVYENYRLIRNCFSGGTGTLPLEPV